MADIGLVVQFTVTANKICYHACRQPVFGGGLVQCVEVPTSEIAGSLPQVACWSWIYLVLQSSDPPRPLSCVSLCFDQVVLLYMTLSVELQLFLCSLCTGPKLFELISEAVTVRSDDGTVVRSLPRMRVREQCAQKMFEIFVEIRAFHCNLGQLKTNLSVNLAPVVSQYSSGLGDKCRALTSQISDGFVAHYCNAAHTRHGLKLYRVALMLLCDCCKFSTTLINAEVNSR